MFLHSHTYQKGSAIVPGNWQANGYWYSGHRSSRSTTIVLFNTDDGSTGGIMPKYKQVHVGIPFDKLDL
jgi:hypothetical protein